MPSLNGYGQLEGTLSDDENEQNVTVDTAAESFVRDGLSKVMKITNICDNEHLSDCGLPDKIIPIDGGSAINLSDIKSLAMFNVRFFGKRTTSTRWLPSLETYEQLDTKAAAFETVNGESILVYYNPNCIGNMDKNENHFLHPYLCANFVYDLNGKKGPNTVGKDIGFITALYSTDPVVVAPNPYPTRTTGMLSQENASLKCKNIEGSAKLPNIDEVVSMFYNRILLGNILDNVPYWSSTALSATDFWAVGFFTGVKIKFDSSTSNYLWCIKK